MSEGTVPAGGDSTDGAWQRVSMGMARIEVPDPAIVHEIEDPPDDLTAMRLIRTEALGGVACVIILTARPWEDGWHLKEVVERFSANCEPESVSLVDLPLDNAKVARRLEGTIRMSDGYGTTDDLEAMTMVLVRTRRDELVTMTIRMDRSDRESVAALVDRIVGSLTIVA